MKQRLSIVILILIGIACFWQAGRLNLDLIESRQKYDLNLTQPMENAPPLVVFSTVALGGFSGIIADLLWVRAAQLQMDGQYFELVQLADWITKLEPRFTEGWVYHAWNLAYNVSVMFTHPEDRWRWVRHGIELLRDGALRYNPTSAQIHRELGWFFQHKVGATTDQAHHYYKFSWAMEMSRLFDGPRPDYDLYARIPERSRDLMLITGMPELVEEIRALGYDPFSYEWPSAELWAQVVARLRDREQGGMLLHHMQLRIMKDRYKLDPVIMQRIENDVGPLDWRLYQAHSIYWAWNGLEYAQGFDRANLTRMIFQNMAESFRHGRFFYNADEDFFTQVPNPDILPYVLQAFEGAIREDLGSYHFETAHRNFLEQAMVILYTYNRQSEARALFDILSEQYPSEQTEAGFNTYVIQAFTQRAEDLGEQEVLAMVEGSFFQSYYWLALGDLERAAGFERLARMTWQSYMEPRMHNEEFRERTGLPPLSVIRQTAREHVRQSLYSVAARNRLRD